MSEQSCFTFVVTILQVFSNADAIDYSVMVIGTLGSMVVGISNPAMDLLFGRILNSLNESSDFVDEVNTLCFYLAIIAAFNSIAGFVQVCAMILLHRCVSICEPNNCLAAGLLLDQIWRETDSEVSRTLRQCYSFSGDRMVR